MDGRMTGMTTPPEPPPSAHPVFDPASPATWPDPPAGRCWFVGCPHDVPQVRDSGRRKAVCEQVVDGLRHTRLNRSRAKAGLLVVPTTGSGGPAATPPVPAGPDVATAPVTQARQTFGQVVGQVQGMLAGLPGLVDRLETAARTVANQEAAATEIAGAHRASRAAIDAAETERDTALAQA